VIRERAPDVPIQCTVGDTEIVKLEATVRALPNNSVCRVKWIDEKTPREHTWSDWDIIRTACDVSSPQKGLYVCVTSVTTLKKLYIYLLARLYSYCVHLF